jgi:hypothetical protein
MSTPNSTLSTVAIDVVGQYNLAGKSLVQAYRAGSERVLRSLNDGYAGVIGNPLPLVGDQVKATLADAQGQVSSAFTNGVALVSQQAEEWIDRVAEGATAGIERIAGTELPADLPFGKVVNSQQALDTLNAINLSAAQLSLQIATQVAESSKRLSDQIGADEGAAAKPARKRATRSA